MFKVLAPACEVFKVLAPACEVFMVLTPACEVFKVLTCEVFQLPFKLTVNPQID